jgi:hypothetical protein
MLRLKGCPRCHGDLCTDEDEDWSCLQCGNRLLGPRSMLGTERAAGRPLIMEPVPAPRPYAA